MEEAFEETKHEEEVKIENDEENHETEIEAPPATPRKNPEVTPPLKEKLPKAKARGRPVGSTSKNTYQQLADRLAQIDAKLREREEQLNARVAEREEQRRQQQPILLKGGPEEAAAHLISQLGLQAEERHRQKLQMYRSFLPPVSYTHLTLPTICSV